MKELLEKGANADPDFILSDTDELIGIEASAVVSLEPKRTIKNDNGTETTYDARNQIKRFQAIE